MPVSHLPTPHAVPRVPATRRVVLTRPLPLLALITAIGLGLRLYKLAANDFFDDELVSIVAARLAPVEMFRTLTAVTVHPPLYYMLLHGWMLGFGEGLVSIRMLSVLISAACVPLIYVLGRQLATPPVALLSAALMACSPFQIFHGQQARMYSLLTLTLLVSTILFLRAWRTGATWSWVGLGLAVAASLYTHVYAPFSLLALNLWVLWECWHSRTWPWRRLALLVGVQALALLAFAPFLPDLLFSTTHVVRDFWVRYVSPFSWLAALLSLSNNATLAWDTRRATPQWYFLLVGLPALLVVALVLLDSVWRSLRVPAERGALLLLLGLLWTPLIVATLISWLVRPIFLDRSLIAVSVPLYLLMAMLFVRYWRMLPVQLLAFAYALTLIASLAYAIPDAPQPNELIALADYVAREQRPGDAVAYADTQSFYPALLRHPAQADLFLLPTSSADDWHGWSPEWMRAVGWQPQQVAPAATFAPAYRRVWLVLSLYNYDLAYQQQVNHAWLKSHGTLIEQHDFERGVVYLYELRK